MDKSVFTGPGFPHLGRRRDLQVSADSLRGCWLFHGKGQKGMQQTSSSQLTRGGSGQPLGTPADGSRRFSSPTRLLRDRNITLLMRLWNFFFFSLYLRFFL